MTEPTRDFVGALRAMQKSWGQPGLIAEVKKASPRRGPSHLSRAGVSRAVARLSPRLLFSDSLPDAHTLSSTFLFLQQGRHPA